MKKILLVTAILCIAVSIYAQTPWGTPPYAIPNPPVIDISNLIQAMKSGSEMVDNLNKMYNTLEMNIKKVEETKRNMENGLSQIKSLSEFNVLDPAASLKKMVMYGARMGNYAQEVEAMIIKKDLKIGIRSYSIADLFTKPIGDVYNEVADYFYVDPFEVELTEAQKRQFMLRYGMSYGNYMRLNAIGAELQKKAIEIEGFSEILAKELKDDFEMVNQIIMNATGEAAGELAQHQQANALLMLINKHNQTLSKLTMEYAELFAMKNQKIEIARQIAQEPREVSGIERGSIDIYSASKLDESDHKGIQNKLR